VSRLTSHLLLWLAAALPAAAPAAGIDETRARQAGQAAVQTVIPRKMDYRKLKLGLMPFRATVHDLTISENERFARHPLRDWPHFYNAREVDITAELLPLLIGRINITGWASATSRPTCWWTRIIR